MVNELINRWIEDVQPYIPGRVSQLLSHGSNERNRWLEERKKFFGKIFPEDEDKQDFIDSTLESEIPDSLIGILTTSFKVFGKARKLKNDFQYAKWIG